MSNQLDRRSALIGALSTAVLTGCSSRTSSSPHTSLKQLDRPIAHKTPLGSESSVKPSAIADTKSEVGIQPVTGISPRNRQFALTIDDGVSSEVVAGYAKLCKETGMRLTFFANGRYDSWRENASILRPMIESGQVVIGNHTFDHPNLTKLTPSQIAREMSDNEKHFKNLFGISMKPFMRPPYGAFNEETLKVLHDLGYKVVVMWYGTLGDDQNISSAKIMRNAVEYLQPGRIVIGHANHPGVLSDYGKLHSLIEQRRLRTVTVKDVLSA